MLLVELNIHLKTEKKIAKKVWWLKCSVWYSLQQVVYYVFCTANL